MKKYKIVQEEKYWKLYKRNDQFVIGLALLPFFIVSFVVTMVTQEIVSFIAFMCFLSLSYTCLTCLSYGAYQFIKVFFDETKLHDYIAEDKLKNTKTNVFYID